jgi:hypothetical protein
LKRARRAGVKRRERLFAQLRISSASAHKSKRQASTAGVPVFATAKSIRDQP